MRRTWGWLTRLYHSKGLPRDRSLAGVFGAYVAVHPDWTPGTRDRYLDLYGLFLDAAEAEYHLPPESPMLAIDRNREVLDAFAVRLAGRNAEALKLLKRVFEWAAGKGYCTPGLAADVTRPRRTPKQKPPACRGDAFDLLLERIASASRYPIRDTTLVGLYRLTGMRNSSLRELRVEDVHVDCEEPYLHARLKGGRIENIPIGTVAAELLRRHLATLPAQALYVFASPRDPNRPLARRSVSDIVKRHARGAGLPERTRVHSFRHGFATDLIENGEDVETVRQAMGHRSVQATFAYVADNPARQRAAAARQEMRLAPIIEVAMARAMARTAGAARKGEPKDDCSQRAV